MDIERTTQMTNEHDKSENKSRIKNTGSISSGPEAGVVDSGESVFQFVIVIEMGGRFALPSTMARPTNK